MITSIKLENFKCFRKIEVNPRPITVFVGPNGSGKSSVLQAMALLKQSVGRNALLIQGNSFDFAEINQITPKFPEMTGLMHIEFGGSVKRTGLTGMGFVEHVHYRYAPNFAGNGRLVSLSGDIEFTFEGRSTLMSAFESGEFTNNIRIGEFIAHPARTNTIATVLKINAWTGLTPEGHIQETINELMDTPTSVLKATKFTPAVRGFVRPLYSLGPELSNDVSFRGGLNTQEDQTATNLIYLQMSEGKISDFLKRVTGMGLRVNLIPPRAIELHATTPIGNVNIIAEGFGTNGLIFLFYQLASASKGATVMIEEPEIHLHPRAQADLASVLMEEAKAEDKQLIMTTHSEHILGRLLTLVAEKKLSPDELAIYAFEKDEQGVCTANELEVTEDGRVKGGIKDFLEPDLDELERYLRAMQPSE
jgi:energy-coupling factor transporter ATP-binding protein EcfA2